MDMTVKKAVLTYNVYENYVNGLKNSFSDLQVATCGKSVLGKSIYSFVVGEGLRQIVYVGGTHGNEWLTSLLLLRFSEKLMIERSRDGAIAGYKANEILKKTQLLVIPELNPDGIEIAIRGAGACEEYKGECIKICNGDFSNWSANVRGVDINHNFNADWYALRDYEKSKGISAPSPRRFGGPYPESEPETKAITRLCRHLKPDALYTFHSQGEEIYYEYGTNTPEKALTMARALAGVSDYTLVKNEGHAASGGLKDWFIEEFGKPAFTVEVGKGKNPLPLTDLDPIYDTIEPMLVLGLIL